MADLCLLTLASGRSGTSFLYEFFRHHVRHCHSSHEPYLARRNPTLFGRPVYWNATGQDELLLPLLEQKRRYIANTHQPVYLESNHALLKSAHRHMHLLAEKIGFIRLRRNPLKIAKSEYLREQVIHRFHVPMRYYRVDKQRYFRWSLTGLEPVFQGFELGELNRFQFYLLQWLEIERRADQVLKHKNMHHKVFYIDVEEQLQDRQVLKNLLDFFGLDYVAPFNLKLRRNKTPFVGNNELTEKDYHDTEALLENLVETDRQRLLPYLGRTS